MYSRTAGEDGGIFECELNYEAPQGIYLLSVIKYWIIIFNRIDRRT